LCLKNAVFVDVNLVKRARSGLLESLPLTIAEIPPEEGEIQTSEPLGRRC
jgi:hypothetical protein